MTRTLADMTPDERAACVGRWAERKHRLIVITAVSERVRAADWFCPATVSTGWDDFTEVTPRFDLPRAWTPNGEPVPGEWVGGSKPPTHTIPHQGGFNQIYRRFVTDWEVAP